MRVWTVLAVATVTISLLLGNDGGSCVPVEPTQPLCTEDVDCAAGQICVDGDCVPFGEGWRCEGMGGTCTHFMEPCGDDFVEWTPMDCPMGRSGKCCLPLDGDCEGVLGGECRHWEDTCPEGFGGTVPMNCPGGRSAQCCVLLQ